MSSMIQLHSWLNLLTAARLNQTWFKKYFPVSLSTIYTIKREDIMLEILYSNTIKRYGTSRYSEEATTILGVYHHSYAYQYLLALVALISQ